MSFLLQKDYLFYMGYITCTSRVDMHFTDKTTWSWTLYLTLYLIEKLSNTFENRADPDWAALVRTAWSGSLCLLIEIWLDIILLLWTWQLISLFYVQTWKFFFIYLFIVGGAYHEYSWRKGLIEILTDTLRMLSLTLWNWPLCVRRGQIRQHQL